MAKTFFPEMHEHVPASAPHPPRTYYRVSIGLEEWGLEEYVPVVKVQMVYDGKISGRKPPSYPLGTDDFVKVGEHNGRFCLQPSRSHLGLDFTRFSWG